MENTAPVTDLERRKQVKLRRRADLTIVPQKYEGRTYYVVKDPVSLRYYRFKEQEHYLLQLMDGGHTLDEAQKQFEKRFRPERLRLEDLEQFGQQLLKMGLVQNESPQAGKLLYENRRKRRRMEWLQTFTNILYIKIPVFDPDRLLTKMLPYLWWMFTRTFLVLSIAYMLSAAFFVLLHFETFYSKLPDYHEFFRLNSILKMMLVLGVVKVIHEFGHGLSCKAFGGEVHEMGFLILCLSPAMYCNVSDAWRLPSKWHRILISFAGIYVELMVAATATFLWWNPGSATFLLWLIPDQSLWTSVFLSLMVVCSVNTVFFNGNPLMRYDGYYVLADWLEIPNLRDRANKYLQNLAMTHCLGIETQPEPYMELTRRILFLTFAIVSYVYRWVITFVILKFMAEFLKPYKLEVVSEMLAAGALASMIGWPVYRLFENVRKRGRLPDMKPIRVTISASIVAVALFVVFFVPLPVSRIRQHGIVQVQPTDVAQLTVEVPGILKVMHVEEGQFVRKGKLLAEFTSPEVENQEDQAVSQMEIKEKLLKEYNERLNQQQLEPNQRAQLLEQRAKVEGEWKQALSTFKLVQMEKEKMKLCAPRDGVVIGLPPIDEVGKRWDREQNTVFCSIGNKAKLRVLVPLTPPEYDLLLENYNKLDKQQKKLPVTIRVQGHDSKQWLGYVTQLPKSKALEVPVQLTNKAGGPVAAKPSSNPGSSQQTMIPQNQVFLVGIDLEQPDDSIAINSIAHVKIHNEYRSTAWWIYRSVYSAFDIAFWVR